MDDIFATRLKALRRSRRLTLREVGDAVECSLKTISNLENSINSPSPDMLLALAKFFNVSADYLVGRSDQEASLRTNNPSNNVALNRNYILNMNRTDAPDTDESANWSSVFAERLRALRLARCLTLQNVGDVVGRDLTTVGNMEKAHRAPSLSVLLTLADFFGVSVDYLVGWSDNPEETGEQVDGDTTGDTGEQISGQKKLIGIIESLNAENIDKALGYMALLQEIQQRENAEKKRLEETES